jgi:hypothetical protein
VITRPKRKGIGRRRVIAGAESDTTFMPPSVAVDPPMVSWPAETGGSDMQWVAKNR